MRARSTTGKACAQPRAACRARCAFSHGFAERLQFRPAPAELAAAVQAAGLRTAILSGGFTYFTERLRIELG